MDVAGYSLPAGRGAWTVSSEEFSRHFTYFLHLVPPGGLLSGDRAREFFLQTNVPPLHLAHIWKLSDLDCDGCLDGAEFCVAMCLIHHWLSGTHLPTSLPPPLVTFYHQAKWPHLPPASEEHVLKCKKVFEVFQKNIKSGKMIGKAAKYLLNKSNLPVEQLHHIWNLSDRDRDGKFTFPEFVVAMHLVFLAKVGFLLPMSLESSAILPEEEFSKLTEDGAATNSSSHSNEATPTNTPTPPNITSADNKNNPFETEAFVDLPTSHYQNIQYSNVKGNPFLPVATESALPVDLDGETEGDILGERETETPSPRDVSVGEGPVTEEGGEGGNLRFLYPESKEAIELPSQLSVILEERNEDDQEGEENEEENEAGDGDGGVVDGRGNPVAWYNSSSQQTESSQGDGDGSLPWYQEYTNSQDAWKTTPAYRSEEVWPVVEDNEAQTKFLSPQATIQKVVVTEDTVPQLQVAMAVEVVSKSPLLTLDAREKDEELNEEEEEKEEVEGLTLEDLEDLEKINQESNQFLREHGVAGGSGTSPRSHLLLSEDLQGAGREGLQATIDKMEVISPPPDFRVTTASEAAAPTTTEAAMTTREAATTISGSATSSELEMLAGLEAEMESLRNLAVDDTNWSNQFVSAVLGKEESHHQHTRNPRGHNDYSSNDLPAKANDSAHLRAPTTSPIPPPIPPLPRSSESPPPLPPLPVSPRPSSQSPSPSPVVEQHPAETASLPKQVLDTLPVRQEVPHLSRDDLLPSSSNASSLADSRESPRFQLTTRPLPLSPMQPHPPPSSPQTPSEGGAAAFKSSEQEENWDTSRSEGGSGSGSRRRIKFSKSSVDKMEDLDSLFEGEMASINEMFQEFEIKDKQNKKRQELEQEDLKKKTITSVDVALPKVDLEEVSKRRSMEAQELERQWKEKMERLEKEQLESQEQSTSDPTNIILQDLDNELQSLIKSKEEEVKQTQIGKEQYARRQKEEKERKEKERLEKLARQKEEAIVQEMTIEEWITWMEEKKKKGMTEEQQEEYERRKAARQKLEKEREEKRKREEEDKKRMTKEKIDSEIRLYRMRVHEVNESRLSEADIRRNFEEMARKNEEESKQRKEKGLKMRENMKQQEIEELKPKARSALAARWEESVKSKTKGNKEEQRATVVTRARTASGEEYLEREEERLTRRISGHFPNGTISLSPEKKRHSTFN